MLRPILYYTLTSPPSRSTLLAATAIGLDLDLRKVNLLNLEHLKPGFLEVYKFFERFSIVISTCKEKYNTDSLYQYSYLYSKTKILYW